MRAPVLTLILLCGVTFFIGLGRPAITDSDEAYYAEAGREMLESGDWLTPHYNYTERFQKPVLFYWLVAATYLVAGVGEAAARFWAAAACLGLVLATFAYARRSYDGSTGLWAGAIVATSVGCVSIARLSLPDAPLAFFVTLTVCAALAPIQDPGRKPARWIALAAAAAALGFLTKGPVALVLPAIVLLPIIVIERRWDYLRPTHLALALAVFLAIGAPWYLAMAARHGVAYLQGFFIGDNLERFATERFNSPRPIWYYGPIVFGGMLPWSPFFLLCLPPLWRRLRGVQRLSRPEIRLLIWTLAPLVFFTASVGKQPRYILPLLPPLGIALARAIRRRVEAPDGPVSGRPDPLFALSAGLTGLVLATLGVAVYRATSLLLTTLPAAATATAGSLVLVGVALAAMGASSRWRRTPVLTVLASTATILIVQAAAFPPADKHAVREIAAIVKAHHQPAAQVGTYHVFVRNLIFYTHLQQTDLYNEDLLKAFVSSEDPVLCVLSREDAATVERDWKVTVRPLASARFFDVSGARLRTLLAPDPERDLQTVFLITNR